VTEELVDLYTGKTIRALAVLLLFGVVAAQSPDLGAQLASEGNGQGAAACSSCHGANGEGMPGTAFPRLAALPAGYLASQLQAFRDGTRNDPVMSANAKALTDEEVAAAAEYYASLDAPAAAGTAAEEQEELGRFIAERGAWHRYVPSCQSCHGPGGMGVGDDFPPLAGQSAAYMVKQFADWQANSRTNDPLGMMHAVAARLTDEEIEAVAAWYSAVSPAVPEQED